jgi:RNA polymerase sigma-70 factor (ECF subfamily)
LSDEKRLVERARKGDSAAFETLVNNHARYVYNLAFRVVGDHQEAEDLSQETFIRAWRGLPRFRGQSKFSTWLYRIVTNLCYNRLPALKRQLLALDPDAEALDLPDERQGVETGLLTRELRQHLHQAVDQLPESYRLLITLRHLQDMRYTEISQVTGLPLGTVKTGIFRARRLLRESLEAYEESYGRERHPD